ncbi:MAG: metallophosphoesterase, partial [Gammaproteobacteria bacterium]
MTRRGQEFRKIYPWLFMLWILLFQIAPVTHAAQWQWNGVERVVAVGDMHGAYDEFISILTAAGLVNSELGWTGGKTHLVSVGDIVDRGERSRELLDLVMRLQQEAAAAGGQVHVTLANHEAMRLSGEFEYISDEEYAAFTVEELAEQRAAGYQRYLTSKGLADDASAQASFASAFPPGYFGLQAAFSPQGRYGSWILERPVVVIVNDTAYMHGGISDSLGEQSPEQINQQLQSDLRAYAEAWQTLLAAGVLAEDIKFGDRAAKALAAVAGKDAALVSSAEQLATAETSQVFTADGPLWNRGTVWCNPNAEVIRVDRALNKMGVSRVALGHTPTVDSTMISRMDGRVVMLDTGMLRSVYHGRPSALIETPGNLSVVYADTGDRTALTPEIRRVGTRPGKLTDDEIEKILSDGEIISIEDVGQGVT